MGGSCAGKNDSARTFRRPAVSEACTGGSVCRLDNGEGTSTIFFQLKRDIWTFVHYEGIFGCGGSASIRHDEFDDLRARGPEGYRRRIFGGGSGWNSPAEGPGVAVYRCVTTLYHRFRGDKGRRAGVFYRLDGCLRGRSYPDNLLGTMGSAGVGCAQGYFVLAGLFKADDGLERGSVPGSKAPFTGTVLTFGAVEGYAPGIGSSQTVVEGTRGIGKTYFKRGTTLHCRR